MTKFENCKTKTGLYSCQGVLIPSCWRSDVGALELGRTNDADDLPPQGSFKKLLSAVLPDILFL